jgi:hypothetical protein
MRNMFDEDTIALGLDEIDIQAMAKRQFFASAAAAIVIGIGVILMATAPAPHDYAVIASHGSWIGLQPNFVGQTTARAAEDTRQRQIELP